MQKQYHNNKGLLKTINKNTPEYADHALNAVALEQVFWRKIQIKEFMIWKQDSK